MKTTLFIPVKNEIEGLKVIMPRIKKEWIDEILFVDGNSTDGTTEYLKENGYKTIVQRGRGVCDAYWEAVEHAQGEVIIAFSPDNNSIPEVIPELVNKMNQGFDMVIASRYKDDAKSEDDDWVTGIGNFLFTKAVNLLFGGKYTDTLVMFRAFRKDLADRLGMKERSLPTFEYQLSIGCARDRLRVTEIPAPEPKRIGGVRKMHPIYNGSSLIWILAKEFFKYPLGFANHFKRSASN